MRTFWHQMWGSARGPVMRLVPETRILAGAMVFATCMVAPAETRIGASLTVAAAASWIVTCRPPAKVIRAFLLLGLAVFLPYFLLLPIIQSGPSRGGPAGSLLIPWRVFLRGTSTMLVSVTTITCLSASDLSQGLARLPLPGVVSAILMQIVHQTRALVHETKQIAAAMAMRGAAGSGRTTWRVLTSLPRVWLPRVMLRAERVAAAMELRGYCDGGWRPVRRSRWRLADRLVLVLVIGVLSVAVALRWWGAA
jgi:cobalt/nickel transport system permease protein